MTQFDAIITLLIMVSIMGGMVFFMFVIPNQIGYDYIEQEICIKNGYDELRYISKLGIACMKYEPEPIAHIIDCENRNMTPLAYFGAKPEGCILLKELVVIK